MKATLYYIHDPMCSWCWGVSETLQQLIEHLPQDIAFKRRLGGLAPDTDEPMPGYLVDTVKTSWRRIEENIPGKKFNFEFWEKNIPRRSTYPACRAVIAARKQGNEFDEKMTKAIQQAYYQDAKNPSDKEVLTELAGNIGVNKTQFIKDLESKQTNDELMTEIEQAREMFVESYPSLVLECGDEHHTIVVDYHSYENILSEIEKILC